MLGPLLDLLGWSLLLLVAVPALWTGGGAMVRPPHDGARVRGFGVLVVALVQAGLAVWLLAL